MTIRVNLDLMLLKRGMTLTALAEAVDVTQANLSILKTKPEPSASQHWMQSAVN